MKHEMDQLIDRMIAGGILFEEALQEFEKQFILKVLSRHNNNLSKASVALGIHRNTLSKRLEQYQNGNGATPHKPAKKRKQVSPRLKIRS
ncbi:MAG TPA: helix-turn-helix domain-containing protein [Blastocatellia bacterium]|nr:helix-turn-helix domain-containing protein [Blastocatellia bacterium]